METVFHYLTPPHQCGYLPDQTATMEYDIVRRLSPAEYLERMRRGWRRFGVSLFRPRCTACSACQSLRVIVDRFQPNRSQRRAWKMNDGVIRLQIGSPSITRAKLELYDRYHAYQADAKDWPFYGEKDAEEYARSFVANPFPTQEWCYYLGRQLVGVGYVDDLPGGMSAIYFFYDPDLRHRSPGTYNVLNLLAHAKERGIPHLYLGYYVSGCQSMLYKAKFRPYELLGADGRWSEVRS